MHGDTLYISGTRSDGDVLDNAHIPFKAVHKMQRYQQALAALKRAKDVSLKWSGIALVLQ